jgi:hypothetical protein
MSDRIVLITESTNSTKNFELSTKKDKNSGKTRIFLEGVFTQFGVINNNQRLYEEKDFLPHLEYLQEKIQEENLVGELDHPERFDVRLQHASHKIDLLEYESKSRSIVGRIVLLDTDAGVNAQKLIEGGVSLSISSRAAGLVRENKTVEIKQVFTYDLVANPGFKNAKLNRINESLGYTDRNIGIYDVSEMKAFVDDYERCVGPEKHFYSGFDLKENKTQKMNSRSVTEEELAQYTRELNEKLKGRFSQIEKRLNNSAAPKSSEVQKLVRLVEQLIRYNESELVPEIRALKKYAEFAANTAIDAQYDAQGSKTRQSILENRMKKHEAYSDLLAEELNATQKYASLIAESANEMGQELKQTQEYASMIAESTNGLAQKADGTHKMVKKTMSYVDSLSEVVNDSLNHLDYIAENLDHSIAYQENTAKVLNESIAYSESIGSRINEHTDYLNYSAKITNAVANYANDQFEKISESSDFGKRSSDKYISSLTKIDQILESLHTQKSEPVITESNFRHYKFVSESVKRHFYGLNSIQRQKIVDRINEVNAVNETEITRVFAEVLNENRVEDLFIINMPDAVRPIWETLQPEQKSVLIAESKFFTLTSQAQIDNFWSTRTIGWTPLMEYRAHQPVVAQNELNESQRVLGYTIQNKEALALQMQKRFGY